MVLRQDVVVIRLHIVTQEGQERCSNVQKGPNSGMLLVHLYHVNQVPNEIPNGVLVACHHHVSILRCHDTLLKYLYDIFKLRCREL